MEKILDQLLIETAVIGAKQRVVTEMTLSVFAELLPEEAYKAMYSNYVDKTELALKDVFRKIEPILFDKHHILYEKEQALKENLDAKNSEDYICLP